jgi:sulfhydrogenase subunit delta
VAAKNRKPRLAVWKFSSCDGCQLSLLDCEDELLAVAGAVDIAYFLEATRGAVRGRYDLSLVEGSITTASDAARIRDVRARSRTLVTIGACATAGGIQALRNWADVKEYASVVYARPDYIQTLATSTSIARCGRFRAAWLPDQQAPASGGHLGHARRPPPDYTAP